MTPETIAITMGDPSGIGPEIIAKLFTETKPLPRAVVVGDSGVLERTIHSLGLPLTVRVIDGPEQAKPNPGTIDLISGSQLPRDLPVGRVDARSGRAAYEYVRMAIELAMQHRVCAITTAPLNKEAMHAAGIQHPGHTEILADLTGTDDYAMMLINEELRVILVSVHVPLVQAIRSLTVERELTTIRLAERAGRWLGASKPRIAVAGVNPHAGENGMFGSEDAEIVAPAVRQALLEGIQASGPWPGDTVFMRARRGDFDIVVAQYHDQGLIPVKYLGIEHGVNITVGLPFVRTSVDHGTAFDIAGTGRADHTSLKVALEQAAILAAATR
jgi:4-hydroxythreonine-4-phosphate dehydrogenase